MKDRQFATILWLRWRLTRNGWRRRGGLDALFTVLVGILGVGLAGGGSLVGLLIGAFALRDARSLFVMLTWLGLTFAFLFMWTIGVLMELQRSEIVDLQRLMHLPISLSRAFTVNYLASLVGVTTGVFVPTMLGLTIGLAMDRGPLLLLLGPLSLGLVFMVTAWTYLLQGWIALWVQNPRRRRALFAGIALFMALVFQAPNLFFNVLRDRPPRATTREERLAFDRAEEARFEHMGAELVRAERFIPPLWLAGGAGKLAERDPLFALLGTGGFAVLGAFALRRGYRSTLRYYSGDAEGGARPRAPSPSEPTAPVTGRRLIEWSLPLVPEPAAAIAAATLRSQLRAPEILMSQGFAILMIVIAAAAGGRLVHQLGVQMGAHVRPLALVGAMLMTSLPVAALVNNQFGYDREGFRALLLAPITRQRLLLGKNLAVLPLAAVPCGAVLIAGSVVGRLGAVEMISAVLQMVTLLLTCAISGNLLSILLPFRVQGGAMKATMPPMGILLAVAFFQLSFPVLCVPAYLGPALVLVGHYAGWAHPRIADFAASLAMATVAILAYSASLAPLGRLLQRRETLILARVAASES